MERRLDRQRAARDLRHFSPPGMVAKATERRLAGDWRGACAAALVEVHIDLRDAANVYGAGEIERIEADLTGFAPDLLRRFLPRGDAQVLRLGAPVVLSRLEQPVRLVDGQLRQRPVLTVTTPTPYLARGRQSLALRIADLRTLTRHWHDFPSWSWHQDAVASRRWAYGASDNRLPWHFPDGTPHPQGTPPGEEQDRAAELERLAAGTAVEALAAAGFAVDIPPPRYSSATPEQILRELARTVPLLREEAIRLALRYGQNRLTSPDHRFDLTDATREQPTVREASYRDRFDGPYVFNLETPPDVTLLRWGDLHPDELHPLVHEALFPGRTQHWRPPAEPPAPSIRVRCGGQRHELVPTGGYLTTPHHAEEEIRREFVLAGLGGPIGGCAAAVRGWLTGARPIPKPVRKLRQELFALALHGDTDTLLELLAGGVDPGLRGPGGGTLLHWIAHLDHQRMLPLLLDAGLSLDDRDHLGRTPLHHAALSLAEETMAALIAAGADPEARDNAGQKPAKLLSQMRRV